MSNAATEFEIHRILERFEPKVRTYFRRRLASESDIEDLVQEVMCAMIEGYPRYRGDSSIATWVYAICLHKAGEFYRNRDRARSLFARLTVAGHDGISQTSEDELTRLAVDVAYERLSDGMKKLFIDRYREGLSVKEISELHQRAEGTIKYRLYQLRIELRRILG